MTDAPTVELDAQEARLLGVLIEKAYTTPDAYPLTLNAATSGANQKSNRLPEMNLSESEVKSALTRLMIQHLAGAVHPAGSRVEKYRHNALELLKLDADQAAILAELLLRGPQTAGELRTRASRMRTIESLEVLQRRIEPLLERGLVVRLAPSAGSRAERYAQTLAPGLHGDAPPAGTSSAPPSSTAPSGPIGPPLSERVATLESEVRRLRAQLETLAEKLGEPLEEPAGG